MEKLTLKYRAWYKGIPPQKIKAGIPGWAGDHKRHDDGCTPQPWHCVPFMEGALYGLELIYPFDNECRVTYDGKEMKFSGDFSSESKIWEDGRRKSGSPPFMSFAPGHYGFTSSLDLEPPEGYVTRLEPHSRYYSDETGTVPLAVAGHLQRWWPQVFFVVFKAPWPGQTHIFRKGEPYAKILLVPNKVEYDIIPFTNEEIIVRQRRDDIIHKFGTSIMKSTFKSDKGYPFNDKYRQLSKAYVKGGYEAMDKLLNHAILQVPSHKAKRIGKFVKIRKNVKLHQTKTGKCPWSGH